MSQEKREKFAKRVERYVGGDTMGIALDHDIMKEKDIDAFKSYRKREYVEAFGDRDYATDAEKRGVRLPLFQALLKMTGDSQVCPHCGVGKFCNFFLKPAAAIKISKYCSTFANLISH